MARRRHRLLCGWKHAEGAWRSRQAVGLVRKLLTKWLTLDFRFYAALLGAWKRRGEAAARREREQTETVVPLLEVFPKIAETWPPPELSQMRT